MDYQSRNIIVIEYKKYLYTIFNQNKIDLDCQSIYEITIDLIKCDTL